MKMPSSFELLGIFQFYQMKSYLEKTNEVHKDAALKPDVDLCCNARCYWLLAIGYWLLAIGFWLLAIGYWLLAFGFWLLAFGYWLLAIG